MHRQIQAGALVFDQINIYNPPNSFTRVTGALSSQFSTESLANNATLNWPLLDGTLVLDSDISPGFIYLNEISTSPGFYSVRWYPDRIGFWVLSLTYTTTGVESILSYDVLPASGNSLYSGIIASFS